jgi:photosystem II stability/assembly factor-like uncharacterized protein
MRRYRGLVALGLASTLALAAGWQPVQRVTAQAQAVHGPFGGAFFASLKWRNIGPNRGGRSIAVAGSVARPLEYFFGATGGGMWKTTDGGTTWKAVGDDQFGTSSVGAVAVADSNPDVAYAGMGETELRGNIIQGDGVYKTTDGGKTWKHVGLSDTQAIARIRIDPGNPDTVFVAALGHPYGPNDERGVFRSTDGGASWKKVLFRSSKAGAVDLCLDPRDPRVLYAAIWEVSRTPHSLSSGGADSGLFRSTDGGETWTELTRNPGMPRGIVGKIGVAVSGADSNRVFAIVEAEDGGIFRSDDRGATWTKVNDERRFRQRAFYYTRIYADPKARDQVYVLNTGFYRSADGGKSWKTIRVPHGDNHDLWIAPDDPGRMINGNDGGANVSVNGGETWTAQRYPTAQLYHVVTTAHVPYHVCGAQQDNSTACVPVTGSGDEFYDVGGGESGYIAADPANPDVYYAGSYGGLLTRYDRRTGQVRAIDVWPDNPMGHSSNDMRERSQWTFPIVFSPTEPGTLYVGSQHVWRTRNEGQSWERISPDLTRADPSTMGPSGGPITLDQTGVETYATVFTIAPSRREAGTVWVGTDDGYVHVTRDGGRSWQNVTPPDLPPFARVSLIDASPHQAGTAFLAANRYQRDDRAPYMYRTDDFGRTWKKIVDGIAAGDFARAIREDPSRAGLLYAGTEQGVYVSFDGGEGWQSLRLNLPVTPVHDIAVTPTDVVLATHGRSFFVLENVGVLRQLTPAVAAEKTHLFAPLDATRTVSRGVAVDYYLAEPVEKVTIEVLDAEGKVVRTFTGAASQDKERKDKEKAESATPPDEEEGGARPQEPKVPTAKGTNRFVWDMRCAGPTTFPKMILWAASARGPKAPPGRYQVRLTVGSDVQTRAFSIVRNPMLTSVTDADLQEQFTLASQIRDRVSQANEAVIRIRSLKDQLADRAAKAKGGKVRPAAAALDARLTAVEGEIYQYRNQSSQDPLNFPIRLNNKLAALMGVVESGDARPTDQSYAVFKELSSQLDAQLGKLDALVKVDIAAFNRLLAGSKLQPVGP